MNHTVQGSRSAGFTLIELMIAITIVAILVALAVPAYKDYTIRAKITECINGAATAKIQVSEYRYTLGAWPPNDTDAGIDGLSGSSRFCVGFVNYDAATGAFFIDINEAEIEPLLGVVEPRMIPTIAASNAINWDCTFGATPIENLKYLPATCRDS